MPEGKIANWILGNHDYWRVGSRFGAANVDGFNMLSLLLPGKWLSFVVLKHFLSIGVSVTYNGEEIGMINTDISWEDTVDPAGLNCGEEHFNVKYHGTSHISRNADLTCTGHQLLQRSRENPHAVGHVCQVGVHQCQQTLATSQ